MPATSKRTGDTPEPDGNTGIREYPKSDGAHPVVPLNEPGE